MKNSLVLIAPCFNEIILVLFKFRNSSILNMILFSISLAILYYLLNQLIKVSFVILVFGHFFIVIQAPEDDFIAEANGFKYLI